MSPAAALMALLVITLSWPATAAADLILQRGDRWPHAGATALILGSDGRIYAGRGQTMTILDIDLNYMGAVSVQGEIQGICYANERIYAALGADGLQIVDVSDPAAPVAHAIAYQPEEGVDGIVVVGDLAYAAGLNRLAVLDMVDPDNPAELGAVTLPGLLAYATNLSVSGGLAAVADQVNGLHMIDVSSPQQPVWKSLTVLASAWDVAIALPYVLVTSTGGELVIVDVSSPAEPLATGNLTFAGAKFMGLAIAGTSAYVADENNGLQRIDVSDPNNPVLAQTYADTHGAYTVATDGSAVWIGDFTRGLQRIGGGTYDTPADVRNLCVDDDYYLYVVDDAAGTDSTREGLRVLDGFNLGNFVFKGVVATPGEARAVAAAGDLAFVADGSAGLQIIDVAGRTDSAIFSPVIIGSLDTTDAALDVKISGNYAYVADDAAGLRIINVTDPTQPTEAGGYDTDGTATAVAISGHYAYVADGPQGLQIIDVSDPSLPILGGHVALPGSSQDVLVSGDHAYVAAGTGGLQIVDVAAPASPVIVGSIATGGSATGVSITGSHVRVADSSAGLVSVDVTNPGAPVKVNAWSTATNGTARKTVSLGDYVIVAEELAGAAAYKLSDEDPFTPAPFDPPESGGGCFIGLMLPDTHDF